MLCITAIIIYRPVASDFVFHTFLPESRGDKRQWDLVWCSLASDDERKLWICLPEWSTHTSTLFYQEYSHLTIIKQWCFYNFLLLWMGVWKWFMDEDRAQKEEMWVRRSEFHVIMAARCLEHYIGRGFTRLIGPFLPFLDFLPGITDKRGDSNLNTYPNSFLIWDFWHPSSSQGCVHKHISQLSESLFRVCVIDMLTKTSLPVHDIYENVL